MVNELKTAIEEAKSIVFFSGAGMSTASGIPDFRSAQGIYTNNLRAEEIISHSFFISNPEEFYPFYKEKLCYKDAKPNYGHFYIAELEKTKKVTVVTQNIDGLHQAAGSTNVYELHGSVHRNYCMKCHKYYDLDIVLNSKGIPKCSCGGIIKPDVVLYEEGLDDETVYNAIKAIKTCDLLVILGTSLSVYPAASFIRYFKGNKIVIINKSETERDNIADIVIHDNIVSVFKNLKGDL